MKTMLRLLIVSAFALLISVPATFAQTPEYSVLPVTEPLDVGGTILQPGTYTIRVVKSISNRNQVQITSPDLKTVYATVLTVPHPLEPNEDPSNTTFLYFPAGDGQPAALRTWFAPHPYASGGGHDIIYEESRAKQLARLAKSPVVSYHDQTAVAEFNESTPLNVVTPQGEVQTYTYTPPAPTVAQTTPTTETTTTETRTTETTTPMTSATHETTQVAESRSMEMPRTASNVPLLALIGLLAVAAALVVRRIA